MNSKLPLFKKSEKQSINFRKETGLYSDIRVFLLPLFVVSIFLTLGGRLFQLTVVKGAYYRYLAENNRIREIETEAPRGKIVDRKGFSLGYSEKEVSSDLFKRIYPLKDITAHVVGYRQLADKDNIANDLCPDRLKAGDKVGKAGVEKLFECDLRGKKGRRLVEIDAQGKKLKILHETTPQQGKTVHLALDSVLQEAAFKMLLSQTLETPVGPVVLNEKKAAIVAQKPQTGEVLVLTSSPSFNPQSFEDNVQAEITSYFKDDTKPLFNRALEGTYPPGSVFKLSVISSAFEEKAIDESYTIEDTGTIKAGPLFFGNWYYLQYGKTEGMVDPIKALQRSNDIFFYKVGEKTGVAALKAWAQKFGYGKNSGIGLSESPGLVPSAFWKSDRLGERWFLGDTYNFAIGQGYLLTTPLQVNFATAPFANGGYLCKPRLEKVDNATEDYTTKHCEEIGLSEKTIKLVREGMRKACESGGTGWPFFDFKVKNNSKAVLTVTGVPSGGGPNESAPASDAGALVGTRTGQDPSSLRKIQVGCKTGTAESHASSGLPHAWFTVFAPFDNPEIAVTVMVEESGEGSNVAAPIAKEILKTYFERNE